MKIETCLSNFDSVSLNDLSSVRLMDRIDTKFVFQKQKILDLFLALQPFYDVLEVNEQKIQRYRSLYYDTDDRFFFNQHHNNRVNRNKVRFREYVDSGLVFLEIKLKNNKGKTMKKRVEVDVVPNVLSLEQKKYINNITGQDLILKPKQWINFSRITFADKLKTERLTIDLDLNFSNEEKSGSFGNIVVAEVKKERVAQSSKFKVIAKEHRILPVRLSKYCMSTIDLDKDVKYNRFKEKLLLMNKLKKV